MKFNLRQIIEAWVIANNPTDKQLELAKIRGEVCENCPSKKIFPNLKKWPICGDCGCPIAKKIFTNEFNPCPLLKWEEIDKPYFEKRKEKKTFL